MAVVIVSSAAFSNGLEIAENAAQALGYQFISRDVVLEDASRRFNVPEIDLLKAVNNAPTLLERFGHAKARYVSYVRTTMWKAIQQDNLVFHGIAGHLAVQGVPHVFKVGILADFEDRVQVARKRESLSEAEARDFLQRNDEERRKWGQSLYGHDPADATLYDLVMNLKTLSANDAEKTIVDLVKLPSFQTTPESASLLNDLVLAAQIESALLSEFPYVKVTANDREIFIHTKVTQSVIISSTRREEVTRQVRDHALSIEGVKDVKVTLGL